MRVLTLPVRLFTSCLNVSGGMAAHSSLRDVAREFNDLGYWELEQSDDLIYLTAFLRGSSRDSGQASPFSERICPKGMSSHPALRTSAPLNWSST